MKRITDPTFKYIPACRTNVADTIRREQKRLEKEKEAREYKVTSILRTKSHG